MKISIRKGFGFGLTSGIITTLGLIVGLNAGTHSKSVVLGGILIIAIADALSDSLGIHISEESNRKSKQKQVWESTISTFISKFFFALTFIIPILFLPLTTAIIVSIIWGLFLITLFSLYIAKLRKMKPSKVILEHVTITILVIVLTHYVGNIITRILII
jgi:VIT1/CCC1 family predicted Fe2+/Mn2+ transporter